MLFASAGFASEIGFFFVMVFRHFIIIFFIAHEHIRLGGLRTKLGG